MYKSQIRHLATFFIKLPNFYSQWIVKVQAYVEDEVVGQHDLVLGIQFIQQLELTFNSQWNRVTWDEITIPMKSTGSIKRQDMANYSIDNTESPPSVQKAVDRMERHLSLNTYDGYNYKNMVLRCSHLSSSQQDTLLELFSNFAFLFDGSLGKVPNIKIHSKSKK
jgi:hypothetical protein